MAPNEQTTTTASALVNDDTVEIRLTAEEQRWLARAAEVATSRTAPPPVFSSGRPAEGVHSYANRLAADLKAPALRPGCGDFLWSRTARVDSICTVTFVAVVLCLAAATSLRHLAGAHESAPRATAAQVRPQAVVPTPVAVASPAAPVQVRNPFDRTEVFELPPDTGEEQARAAVADLLLQRARDRLPRLPAHASRTMGHALARTTQDSAGTFITKVASTFD